MPACIAHYQFGQDVLNRLSENIKSTVLLYKREFDCGLQGPDIFYFYKPYRHTGIRDYGITRHNEPAIRMFAPILEKVRERAALSYMLGLICHYVLDKCCHPYISAYSRQLYDHQRIESAFDKYMMLTHGLHKARYQHVPFKHLDYEAMALLWPDIDADTFKNCVKSERRAMRVLDRGKFLRALERIAGKPGALTPMTLPDSVPDTLTEHIRNLKILHDKALDECLELILTALEFMGRKLTRGYGFDQNYKGNAADTERAV